MTYSKNGFLATGTGGGTSDTGGGALTVVPDVLRAAYSANSGIGYRTIQNIVPSTYRVGAGDRLVYDLFLEGPATKICLDMEFSGAGTAGTTILRSGPTSSQDVHGSAHPANSANLADNVWLERDHAIGVWAGTSVSSIHIGMEPDAAQPTPAAQFRNARIVDADGRTVVEIIPTEITVVPTTGVYANSPLFPQLSVIEGEITGGGGGGGSQLLAQKSYNPATGASLDTTSTALVAAHADLKVAFYAPASGKVNVTLSGYAGQSATNTFFAWGLLRNGVQIGSADALVFNNTVVERRTVIIPLTGLVPGEHYVLTWAHKSGVNTSTASLFVGGSNGQAIMIVEDAATVPYIPPGASDPITGAMGQALTYGGGFANNAAQRQVPTITGKATKIAWNSNQATGAWRIGYTAARPTTSVAANIEWLAYADVGATGAVLEATLNQPIYLTEGTEVWAVVVPNGGAGNCCHSSGADFLLCTIDPGPYYGDNFVNGPLTTYYSPVQLRP